MHSERSSLLGFIQTAHAGCDKYLSVGSILLHVDPFHSWFMRKHSSTFVYTFTSYRWAWWCSVSSYQAGSGFEPSAQLGPFCVEFVSCMFVQDFKHERIVQWRSSMSRCSESAFAKLTAFTAPEPNVFSCRGSSGGDTSFPVYEAALELIYIQFIWAFSTLLWVPNQILKLWHQFSLLGWAGSHKLKGSIQCPAFESQPGLFVACPSPNLYPIYMSSLHCSIK